MAKRELTLTRTFDVSRERLWQAWTDPNQLAQWWSPNGFSTPTAEIDAKVGGKLYIVMQAGENLGAMSGMKAPMRGTFTQVVPNEQLAFSAHALDEAENVLLTVETSVVFEEVDGKARMTVTASAEGDGPNTATMLAGMEQGWNEQADKLVAFLQN